jgi:hypothetical protein
MEVPQFVDIEVHGAYDKLRQLPTKIENDLDSGWSRDHKAEERGKSWFNDYPVFAFSCRQTKDHPGATLILAFSDETKVYVPNIIPKEERSLSYKEYNSIAKNFYKRFVQPVAGDLDLDSNVSEESRPMDEYASETTLSKLRHFSDMANKTTGSSQPNDRQRWLAFIVSAHQRDPELNSDILSRWLQEKGGWPEDKATDLAIEFEFGRDLLEEYDQS